MLQNVIQLKSVGRGKVLCITVIFKAKPKPLYYINRVSPVYSTTNHLHFLIIFF